MSALGDFLETSYRRYNHPAYIHPDPLEIVLRYSDPDEQAVAGLIASSLALGRVGAILGVVDAVLANLGNPVQALLDGNEADLRRRFQDFVYRFYTVDHLVGLLTGIGGVLKRHGSLEHSFISHMQEDDGNVLPALEGFVEEIHRHAATTPDMLPFPSRGSCCKRLHLYLRWMVRRDAVDPGPWRSVPASKLLIPLDVHMFRMARTLGFTGRKSGSLAACLEITEKFKALAPDDPVRYDFALTRYGIHPEVIPRMQTFE